MCISSVFEKLILPKSCLICALSIKIYIYNITNWGELSSESGARFSWGELSCGELSLGRVVLFPKRTCPVYSCRN